MLGLSSSDSSFPHAARGLTMHFYRIILISVLLRFDSVFSIRSSFEITYVQPYF